MEIRITRHDPATGLLPLWPDSVDAFYADAACTIRSPLTRKNWGYTYRRLQSLHPGKALVAFSTDDLVAYVTQRGDPGPRWAPLTARNYRIALSSLFGWAYLTGRVPADPAARLGRLVRIRHQRARSPIWLTNTQIAALLATTEADTLADRRDRVLLLLGLLVGLRTGELCALRWDNVDLAAGTLRFIGKAGKPALMTMPRQLEEELARWRTTIAAEGLDPTGDLPVALSLRFPSGRYATAAPTVLVPTALGWNGLARVTHDRGLLLGIPDLRPHDLRRTLAGLLDSQGARLQDIRLVLRHDRLATTEAYLRDNPRRVERRMRDLTLPGSSPSSSPVPAQSSISTVATSTSRSASASGSFPR